MRIDIITIFPEAFAALDVSIIGRARQRGLLDIHVRDLRDYTSDRHKQVDDVPYGEDDVESPEGLWVVIRHRPIERLGRSSFLLSQLRNQRIVRPRLVLPEALRDPVREAIEPLLGGAIST